MNLALLWQIFISFMKIDCLCFGGAYAAIPIIQKQVVEINGWLTQSEFMNIMAIDELTPGPIILNCATFIGTQMAGVIGGIVATLGCVFPTALLGVLLVKIYANYKNVDILSDALAGMKCVVVALLISTSISFIRSCLFTEVGVDIVGVVVFVGSFIVLRKTKLDAMFVVLAGGAIGLLLYSFI